MIYVHVSTVRSLFHVEDATDLAMGFFLEQERQGRGMIVMGYDDDLHLRHDPEDDPDNESVLEGVTEHLRGNPPV